MLKIFYLIIVMCSLELFAQSGIELVLSDNRLHNEERKYSVSGKFKDGSSFSFNKILAPYVSIPSAVQLRNKNIALIFGLEGLVKICNYLGDSISKQYFYSLPPYNEQIFKYSIWNDGIAIIISENQNNKLYYLNNNGHVEDSLKINDGNIRGFSLSQDGKYIAYSTVNLKNSENEKSTYIMNAHDNSIIEINREFDNGKYNLENELFLGQFSQGIFQIDLSEKITLWEEELISDRMVLEAFYYNGNIVLVESSPPQFISNNWVYENCKVIKKSLEGKNISSDTLSESFTNMELVHKDNLLILKTDKEDFEIN